MKNTSSPKGPRALRHLVLGLTLSLVGLPGVIAAPAHAESGQVPLVSQIADERISVSAAELRRHLFVAADAARLSDPAHSADLLGERVLQHVYALDPQVDPAAAAKAVRGLLDAAKPVTGPAFDARITRTMVLFQQAATADRGPVAATLQRATTEVVALTAQQITATANDTHAENALGTTGDTESRLLVSPTFTPTEVLRDSAELADADPRFAVARDLLWLDATGVSISATTADLLAQAPRLKDNPEVRALAALRDASGAISTTGGVIAGDPTDPAANTIGATVEALGQAMAETREVAAASTGSTPVDGAVAERAVEDARDRQTALALQTGFLTGGTTKAKDLTDQVGAVSVQVTLLAMAFNEFQGGAMGRAALSGNVLGVVMTLLPGILDQAGVFGPSVDDLMMTQLDNISQQMADFQNAVDGKFAAVFETLAGVSQQLDDISQKIDRAVIDIQQARVQIGQVYDSLSKLQGSLDAVQDNILEALRNGANSQLRQTISSALGYQDRNGTALPRNEFNNAAAFLHTFATVTARHSPELNTDQPSFDPQDAARQLSTGIASNVHFLDRLPAERGWRTGRLSGVTGDAPQLANMDDFVLASRAYSQLMLENQKYVTTGYTRWLGDIQQLGDPLARLTSAISTSDTADGTHSTLLNQLVCARASAAFVPFDAPCEEQTEDDVPVETRLAEATAQVTGKMTGFDGVGKPTPSSPLSIARKTNALGSTFDPFVHTGANPSDLSSLWKNLPGRDQVAQCDVADEEQDQLGAMTRPDGLTPTSQGVPEAYQWADRMGLGTLDVCYQTRLRTEKVGACQFGTGSDGWFTPNQQWATSTSCPNIFWKSAKDGDVKGTFATATYKWNDTAFVWTFTPKQAPETPSLVQILSRNGSSDSPVEHAFVSLPDGGYAKEVTPQLSVGATIQVRNGRTYLVTDGVESKAYYKPLTTVDDVRAAWGDATVDDLGGSVKNYLGQGLHSEAGSFWDMGIRGLDPKLGLTGQGFARRCDPGVETCDTGTDGAAIVNTARATAAVADAVEANLPVLQGDVYRQLLSGSQVGGSTTSGPLADALARLDGANAVLSSFLQLGASKALRERDLTSLPGELTGSKALVARIKVQLARTRTGLTGSTPDNILSFVLGRHALRPLDGLLPQPGSGQRLAASTASTAGPVNAALQSTIDQLALTAVALGAPASATTPVTTPPTTTTPPSTPSATPGTTPTPGPAVAVTFSQAWKRAARVDRRYKSLVTATGGTGTYSWSRQGRLPLGMKGRATGTGTAYVVTGRPVKTGLYTFTLTATDATGATTTRRYQVRVR